jgi:hypothetical protein
VESQGLAGAQIADLVAAPDPNGICCAWVGGYVYLAAGDADSQRLPTVVHGQLEAAELPWSVGVEPQGVLAGFQPGEAALKQINATGHRP